MKILNCGLTIAVAAALSANTSLASTANDITLISADQILGSELKTTDGKEVGELEYIVIETTSGNLLFALIEEDDDLKLEDDNLVVLPFEKLDVTSIDDEVNVSLSLKELSSAMTIHEDDVATLSSPVVQTQVYQHLESVSDPIAEPVAYAKATSHYLIIDDDDIETITPERNILDSKVVNHSNQDFGEIETIVLNLSDDKVAYTIVETDGFLGLGENKYPVPMQGLVWDKDRSAYVSTIVETDLSGRFSNIPKSKLPTNINKIELDNFYRAHGISSDEQVLDNDKSS